MTRVMRDDVDVLYRVRREYLRGRPGSYWYSPPSASPVGEVEYEDFLGPFATLSAAKSACTRESDQDLCLTIEAAPVKWSNWTQVSD